MKLSERWRPRVLADIVGQPNVEYLKAIVRRPRECCVLLEGPPGTGKTTAAYALASELGAVNDCAGLHTVSSAEITIDRVRELFRVLYYTPWDSKTGWKVLVIEELEALPSNTVVRFLKVALEQLPPKTVVVATSNGAAGIDRALLQRFKGYFFGAGLDLCLVGRDRLSAIWERETEGAPMPMDWASWGWRGEEYSLRCAMDDMEDAMEMACVA